MRTATQQAAGVGGRIKSLRERLSLTIPALAEKVGLDRSHLWRIEKGDTEPSLSTLARIADALGVTLPTLLKTPRTKH